MSSKQEIWELEEAICKAMADNARYRTKLGEQALKYAKLRDELHAMREERDRLLREAVRADEAEHALATANALLDEAQNIAHFNGAERDRLKDELLAERLAHGDTYDRKDSAERELHKVLDLMECHAKELSTAKELVAVIEAERDELRIRVREAHEVALLAALEQRDQARAESQRIRTNAAEQARAVVSAAFRAEEKRLEEKSALHGHPVEDRREVGMPFIRASADLASARLLAEAALDRWAAAGCPPQKAPASLASALERCGNAPCRNLAYLDGDYCSDLCRFAGERPEGGDR